MTNLEQSTTSIVSIGLIPKDELSEVQHALLFYRRDPLGGYEFSVRCLGNRRRWQISNENIVINIEGGFARFAGIFDVGADLISSCSYSDATITIDGQNVTARTPKGTITMDGGLMNTEFRVIEPALRVEALLTQECLDYLNLTGPEIPYEPYDIDKTRDKYPTTAITVGDNMITCAGKYNRFGYKRIVTSVPAITVGQGSFICSTKLFSQALEVFFCNRNQKDITIAFDPEEGNFIEVSTAVKSVAVRRSSDAADSKLK